MFEPFCILFVFLCTVSLFVVFAVVLYVVLYVVFLFGETYVLVFYEISGDQKHISFST